MREQEVDLLTKSKDDLAVEVSKWVKTNFPTRTKHYDKCERDVGFILQSLIHCVQDNNMDAIDLMARNFWHSGKLQLKSIDVEFQAYDFLLTLIRNLLEKNNHTLDAYNICLTAIVKLKEHLARGMKLNSDLPPRWNTDFETRVKHNIYARDEEMRIMRGMQQCQRNWDLSKTITQDVVDYLLWIAQNAPSKQHEAYYDVHWSTDRETIEYLYQFSWGSTHRKNPPAMWRNSQMNANLYMIFVCKVPDTMYNCNNDGTLQNPWGESRWENAIISAGMAMALVMRAAHKMGLKTGPNKIKDLGPDYDREWEKHLGIVDDIRAGNKRFFYGLGIGFPNEGRPRWESDDPFLAIGASNGSHCSVKHREHDWDPLTKPKKDGSPGYKKRKIDIVDIREHAGQVLIDPYGNKQLIPDAHEIKINTVYNRDIKAIEIPKKND